MAGSLSLNPPYSSPSCVSAIPRHRPVGATLIGANLRQPRHLPLPACGERSVFARLSRKYRVAAPHAIARPHKGDRAPRLKVSANGRPLRSLDTAHPTGQPHRVAPTRADAVPLSPGHRSTQGCRRHQARVDGQLYVERPPLPKQVQSGVTILPGFMMFCGSSAVLMARIATSAASPSSALRYFILP
jgi:hypothetical protein